MHIPVLQKEVLECLDPQPNENFIDCTIDGAGHALAVLNRTSPSGKVLGIDLDLKILESTRQKIKNTESEKRLILVCDNFANLKKISGENNFTKVGGILFDLGWSTLQMEESGRGFTFMKEEPLDMRFNTDNDLTAEKIINTWSGKDLENIFREYGEERFSRGISERILRARTVKSIKTTRQLAEIIRMAIPGNYERGRINPATRVFQSLRIAVNDEINNLKRALPQALEILGNRGRLVLISFHSLEDRVVKDFFRDNEKQNILKIITEKPVMAGEEELRLNPKSSSAKLRAAVKII